MKTNFLFLASLLFSIPSIAADWQIYFENTQLTIYKQTVECHDESKGLYQEKVFFKFENKSSENINVSFDKITVFSTSKATSDQVTYSVTLGNKESKEGSCGIKDKSLVTFSRFLNKPAVARLQSVEISNIKIQTIK